MSERLDSLRIAPLLAGYRGQQGAQRSAIIGTIMAVQAYAVQTAETLQKVEITPLICTQTRAVAADALIRTGEIS